MKLNGIYIDYANKQQVEWWNNVAGKLVRVVRYNEIVETATNKPVGIIIAIKGVLSNFVIKENKKFLGNPEHIVKATLKVEP